MSQLIEYVEYLNKEAVEGAVSLNRILSYSQYVQLHPFEGGRVQATTFLIASPNAFQNDLKYHRAHHIHYNVSELMAKPWFQAIANADQDPTAVGRVPNRPTATGASVTGNAIDGGHSVPEHPPYNVSVLPAITERKTTIAPTKEELLQVLTDQVVNRNNAPMTSKSAIQLRDAGRMARSQLLATNSPAVLPNKSVSPAVVASAVSLVKKMCDSPHTDYLKDIEEWSPHDFGVMNAFLEQAPTQANKANSDFVQLAIAKKVAVTSPYFVKLQQESKLPSCVPAGVAFAQYGSGVGLHDLVSNTPDIQVNHEFPSTNELLAKQVPAFREFICKQGMNDIMHKGLTTLDMSVKDIQPSAYSTTLKEIRQHVEENMLPEQVSGLEQFLIYTTFQERNCKTHDPRGLFATAGHMGPVTDRSPDKEALAKGLSQWADVYGMCENNTDVLQNAPVEVSLAQMNMQQKKNMTEAMQLLGHVARTDAVYGNIKPEDNNSPSLEQVTSLVRGRAQELRKKGILRSEIMYAKTPLRENAPLCHRPGTYPDSANKEDVKHVLTTALALGVTSLTPAERQALKESKHDLSSMANNMDYFLLQTMPFDKTSSLVRSAGEFQTQMRAVKPTGEKAGLATPLPTRIDAKEWFLFTMQKKWPEMLENRDILLTPSPTVPIPDKLRACTGKDKEIREWMKSYIIPNTKDNQEFYEKNDMAKVKTRDGSVRDIAPTAGLFKNAKLKLLRIGHADY